MGSRSDAGFPSSRVGSIVLECSRDTGVMFTCSRWDSLLAIRRRFLKEAGSSEPLSNRKFIQIGRSLIDS